jgi:hypothetical protein
VLVSAPGNGNICCNSAFSKKGAKKEGAEAPSQILRFILQISVFLRESGKQVAEVT